MNHELITKLIKLSDAHIKEGDYKSNQKDFTEANYELGIAHGLIVAIDIIREFEEKEKANNEKQ